MGFHFITRLIVAKACLVMLAMGVFQGVTCLSCYNSSNVLTYRRVSIGPCQKCSGRLGSPCSHLVVPLSQAIPRLHHV